jgi:hypothetical protein
MGRKVFSILTVKWGGQDVEVNPGGKLDVGGTSATTVKGAATMNFSETMEPMHAEFEAVFGVGDTVTMFGTPSTLQIQTDTGQVYVSKSAWRIGTPTIEGGKMAVVIEGDPMKEMR